MADHHLMIWRRGITIGVIVAATGVVGGLGLPAARSFMGMAKSKTASVQQPHSGSDTSGTEIVAAKPTPGYRQVLTQLVQRERVKVLNFSIPAEFQGKTVRDVKIGVPPTVVASSTGNKPSAQNLLLSPIVPSAVAKPIAQNPPLKPIALTFDDGPWPKMTSEVLDTLKQQNVKATFFVVGKQVQRYPQLVKQAVAEGHAIGNHSWNHLYHHYDAAAASREIDNTASLVYKLTGVKTSLFRPPGGILNNGLVNYAQGEKYTTIMWSVDSRDWSPRHAASQQGWISSMLKDAKPGGIILLHDGGGNRSRTVKALPQLISELKKRGYQFVTVPELLELGDKGSRTIKG
ncbi:MAG TPA: polysaccharide deacetylase family protein [Allocoleopsis sp.]